jgi:SAM-dependent methyltransferase
MYSDPWLAAGYARNRPPVHMPILDRAASDLAWEIKGGVALDIGCGAGVSTKALVQSGIANHIFGVDPSMEMIRNAKEKVAAASFLVGTAEALPVASDSVTLLTAAGSLDYAHFSEFFVEAQRVLSRNGFLLVYDFGPGRRTAESGDLDSWFNEMIQRWPKPRDGMPQLDRTRLESAPMPLVGSRRFSVAIDFELDRYIDYIMTETNVAFAVRSGVPNSEVRAWCDQGLRTLFQGSLRVEFDAYYACFKQPR